jgi:DnaJ C terminal domain
MPFRPEGSLTNWLQQRGTVELLPVHDAVYFIHQAAEALQYAHDNHVEQAAKGINAPLLGKPPIIPHGGDLYATLAISRVEAVTGTSRTLTLPGGRRVTVSIPAHTYDGQILRLEGLGEPSYEGGSRGTLIITLSVKETDATQLPSAGGRIDKTLPASNPGLRRDAVPSSSSSDSDRMSPGPNVSPFAPNIAEAHPSNSAIGTYGQGYIGLFATDHGNPTEVVFQNAKVWTF